MTYSGMLRRMALVRTDVSEECVAFIIKAKRIVELGTALALTSNLSSLRLLITANVVRSSLILVTLMKEVICFPETSVVTRATRRKIHRCPAYIYARFIYN
jgi:hypothetical protein